MPDVDPERPHDSGVAEDAPSTMQVEGAHQLAADARPQLEGKGFTDEQIRKWADAYISEEGSGDVTSFVAWIDQKQDED